MSPFLAGAKLKVKWAKQHINQLNAVITEFSKSDYFKLTSEKDPETGQNGLKVQITKTLPDDVPLMMADIIHNLRSSLDIAISEIFKRETGTYSEWITFPFRRTRDDLMNAINGGDVQKTPKAIRDYIVDGAQPYEAGNAVLWSLHKLDGLEKHLLLIPVASTGIFTVISDLPDTEGKFSIVSTWFNFTSGDTYIPIEGFYNFKIDENFKPTLFVGIDPRGMGQGQQIIPMLVSFADSVSSILDDLERLCSSS